jgi:hypothetical protein
MKKFIKISALVLVSGLLTSSVFATPAKSSMSDDPAKSDMVEFTALKQADGVCILVHKDVTEKCVVTIYNQDNTVIFKDGMPKRAANYAKGYVLTDLEPGDYTIAVKTGNEEVKTKVHVYLDENEQKTFFFLQ